MLGVGVLVCELVPVPVPLGVPEGEAVLLGELLLLSVPLAHTEGLADTVVLLVCVPVPVGVLLGLGVAEGVLVGLGVALPVAVLVAPPVAVGRAEAPLLELPCADAVAGALGSAVLVKRAGDPVARPEAAADALPLPDPLPAADCVTVWCAEAESEAAPLGVLDVETELVRKPLPVPAARDAVGLPEFAAVPEGARREADAAGEAVRLAGSEAEVRAEAEALAGSGVLVAGAEASGVAEGEDVPRGLSVAP